MTAAEVLAALWRRWYVIVVGLVVTILVSLFLTTTKHAYSARATVVFAWPGSIPVSRTVDPTVPILVNFAEMVRLALAADDTSALDSVAFGGSLVGAGVRKGSAVILPNGGGQWTRSYNQPILNIEAVDTSPEAAENEAYSLISQISYVAEKLQVRLDVPTESRVVIAESSKNIKVVDSGATSGTVVSGQFSLTALGMFLSSLAAVSVDRIRSNRRFGAHRLTQRPAHSPRAKAGVSWLP